MIDKKEIEKLAELSRIQMTEVELLSIKKDLENIVNYVGEISSVEMTDTKSDSLLSQKNVFREDVSPHESGLYTEEILDLAPSRENDHFKVQDIL